MSEIGETRQRLATLEAKAAAREKVRAAAGEHARTRQALVLAIQAAHAAGVPNTQIAAASGFTRQWVAELVKDE